MTSLCRVRIQHGVLKARRRPLLRNQMHQHLGGGLASFQNCERCISTVCHLLKSPRLTNASPWAQWKKQGYTPSLYFIFLASLTSRHIWEWGLVLICLKLILWAMNTTTVFRILTECGELHLALLSFTDGKDHVEDNFCSLEMRRLRLRKTK